MQKQNSPKGAATPWSHQRTKPRLSTQKLTKLRRELTQGQCARVFEYLYKKGQASTTEICRECSTGNVSHNVREMNSILAAHGLTIEHFKPQPSLTNQFGEKTQMHVWALGVL